MPVITGVGGAAAELIKELEGLGYTLSHLWSSMPSETFVSFAAASQSVFPMSLPFPSHLGCSAKLCSWRLTLKICLIQAELDMAGCNSKRLSTTGDGGQEERHLVFISQVLCPGNS